MRTLTTPESLSGGGRPHQSSIAEPTPVHKPGAAS
jgi:hypothetical protein